MNKKSYLCPESTQKGCANKNNHHKKTFKKYGRLEIKIEFRLLYKP